MISYSFFFQFTGTKSDIKAHTLRLGFCICSSLVLSVVYPKYVDIYLCCFTLFLNTNTVPVHTRCLLNTGKLKPPRYIALAIC